MGALVIDDETRRSIPNVFMALGITWYYYPENLIDKYRAFLGKHYNMFCQAMFEHCAVNQKAMLDQIV